jgi:3-methyl-2-oxobutanoate hydroxymethyltransferase
MAQADTNARITAPDVLARKGSDEALVMVTAYDAPSARVVDASGADMILVGDTLAMVVLGYDDTLQVTTEEMAHHVAAVARVRPRQLIVGDMPWLSYHLNREETVRNAAQLVRAGAGCVKLEGGRKRLDAIAAILDTEIPVMGHIGLTPQSINQLGAYRVQGKTAKAAQQLLDDARAMEDAGAFAVVLEVVPREIAQMITESISIPTIGIGAGVHCDIQVLVLHDMLGLSFGKQARFVRPYANLREVMTDAVSRYADDVRNGTYPSEAESYALPADTAAEMDIEIPSRDSKAEKS